ncbi:MAG: N-acetyltransferase [Candidatus Heimdallarchaeota archaeon]|nr:N-acetyltransferase [Candidatus Heimdallarchaeota archaeon]
MTKNFIFEEAIPSVRDYLTLRALVGWSTVSGKAVEKSLANSLYSICVYHETQLIGYGRVIGDNGIYFYIQDVIVHPLWQRQGIGRQIMQKIMNYLKIHADPTAFVGLMAAKGFGPFYEPYGFKNRATDAPGMFTYAKDLNFLLELEKVEDKYGLKDKFP